MEFVLKSSSGKVLSKYKEILKENGFELGEFIEESVDNGADEIRDYNFVTTRKYITVIINDMKDVEIFIDVINDNNDFDVSGIVVYREDVDIQRYYVIEIYDEYRE